jgi:membrane protein implicated in regulation of membrane protease activity
LSAAAVGLLGLAGVVMPEWVEWLVFASLSLISMFTFRRTLYEKIRGNVPGFKDGLEGEFIVVTSDLAAGAEGRASLRGADWTIVNGGSSPITAGSRVKVVRNEGLTLYVSADLS